MSMLSALALATILDSSNVNQSAIPMKDLQQNYIQTQAEKFIGVANPLPANAEDKSDNVYEV